MKPKHLWWGATIIWSIALALGMLLPSEQIPESQLWSNDKLVHLGVFMIYSFSWSVAFMGLRPVQSTKIKLLVRALTICIVYGAVLEFLQQFIPGRMTDIYDLLANTLGAVMGTIVVITFTKISLRFLI